MLVGLVTGATGAWLIALGDTWYYLVAGVLFIVSGVLLMRRSPAALIVFGLLVVGTLAWALWEAGLDWWPLAARGDVIFVIGLHLLTPWVTRALVPYVPTENGLPRKVQLDRSTPGLRAGKIALGASLALFLVVSVASWFHDAHEIKADATPSPVTVPAPNDGSRGGTPPDEWHAYGRTGYGQRYSPLGQITPDNVAGLQVAWQYRTGDVRGRDGDPVETTFQATPLKIGNRLYFCTPHQSVIALDATTGAEIWRYNPQIQSKLALQHLTCRGLSYQPAPAGSLPASLVGGSSSMGTATSSTGAVSSKMPLAAEIAAVSGDGTAPSSLPALDPAPVTASPTPTPAAATAPAALAASAGASNGTHPMPVAPPATANPGQPVAAATGLTTTCSAKLFMPTADGRLIALDPNSGAVCANFGGGRGQIDLWANMPNLNPGSYYSTSPVVVTARVVIVGGTVLDNVSTKEQSGVIRAFDINTGALVWNWDSGKPDATAPIGPGERYTPNSPNSWSISSVDEALGLVYVPLGNQPPDQWGGNRTPAVEKYSSSVVALDLATGKARWEFQTVHHDLWDYDVPSQPSLVDLTINGAVVPALVQPTKQGEIFVLDRRTGKPILPVTEVPAPQGAAEGDRTAATQPKSALSFEPKMLTGRDMWGATMFDQMACRVALKKLRYEGRFTPPSTQGSLIYPGNFGVFNWGGVAIDPQRQMAFTTPTYLAFTSKLIPRPNDTALMVQGKGEPTGSLPALNENFGAPFAAKMGPFLSPLGIPCQAPPWGYVAGVDLVTGKVSWMHRNGTVRDQSPIPVPFKMGVPSLGGPMVTAGGVAFLSGTIDDYVRGYNLANGKQIWQSRLPAGGQATPMTYTGADGRQYLLVIAGGHGSLGTRAGDHVIAYALPKN
ncbi:MAG: membrane-bound PQQ-dependent dehydrogenase, glucose/quinate/shikimate family [Variovorax sp.]|nr:MAG: membrane-bound PQQ-dependent dehydrogenase, glucose/quinate/shikimate family [Variovorax sp.]